ncbi:MAG: archaellin/type IV pilin N-terminal domain-containing protein, partial [Stenotrophomonas maltophilia]
MRNLISKLTNRSNPLVRDQRGITGLETAIVLIAFVVVSSVFAFAALSTGLFTTDKAKETIYAGLSEARSTMELKGSVIAEVTAAGSGGEVKELVFQVANAAAGEAIDLSQGNTIIRY